jgi:hypothetical protein
MEATCRICYEESHTDNPVLSLCGCKGTIGLIHKRCLSKWIHISKHQQCELCTELFQIDAFQFEPMYQPNPYLLKLFQNGFAIYIPILFLFMIFTYVLSPVESIATQDPHYTWNHMIKAIHHETPRMLCVFISAQGALMIPAIMILHDKVRYFKYILMCKRIDRMRSLPLTYIVLISCGIVISSVFPTAMACSVVILTTTFHRIHSNILYQINLDMLEDSIR